MIQPSKLGSSLYTKIITQETLAKLEDINGYMARAQSQVAAMLATAQVECANLKEAEINASHKLLQERSSALHQEVKQKIKKLCTELEANTLKIMKIAFFKIGFDNISMDNCINIIKTEFDAIVKEKLISVSVPLHLPQQTLESLQEMVSHEVEIIEDHLLSEKQCVLSTSYCRIYINITEIFTSIEAIISSE